MGGILSHIQHASVAQGGAGTTALVSAPGAGKRIVLHGATLSQDGGGTFKFQSASTDLTGAISTHANAHTAMDLFVGTDCILRCAANEALNITSVTSACAGVVFYSVESTS